MTLEKPRRLCFFGALPDTGNLGVSALCYSVLGGLARYLPTADVTVFDHGRGVWRETAEFASGRFTFTRCGASHTRRYYRRESFWNIRVSGWLGGLGNPAACRLRDADVVLAINGGDSFTDLYGPRCFNAVTQAMRLTLEHDKPLVLLPQTYGPYRDPATRRIAAEIVRRAALAWARDIHSFETLRELAGSAFDPERHRCGVDVAFALERRRPQAPVPGVVVEWLSDDRSVPTIGFNVSGLVFNDPDAAANRYGLRADYGQVVIGFLRRVLKKTNCNVLLVPHVLTPPGHYESDPGANLAVVQELGDLAAARVQVVPPRYDQSEVKWIISRCDWFCGTRMHATIAGLSSGVPTAAIAYSLKTQGVFETCGQGERVADPRELATEEVIEQLWSSFVAREAARATLAGALPRVLVQADAQAAEIRRVTASGDRVMPELEATG